MSCLPRAPLVATRSVVRERPLRILVQALQVGVRGRGVQVEPVLLGVLAVVALAVGEPEHPLLEDRVRAVPQRERQAQPLALVADPGDPVLAPPVGARARLVVREVVPGVAAAAVVLADRAPLALGQIRAPRLPGDFARSGPPRGGRVQGFGSMQDRRSCERPYGDRARPPSPEMDCGNGNFTADTDPGGRSGRRASIDFEKFADPPADRFDGIEHWARSHID